ncbi:hypothetical protein [Dyadobacter sp. 22481]|uniref:hypothetical protein n=1 Tax=Dyadobacter sp. 22481 TaxID=3453926 RepID=UPI003F85FF21
MTRLEFVKSQWEKLSEGYLKKRTGLSIEGPHVVISEIVFDEENWNEYSAKRHDFFKRLLCRYLKAPLIDYIPRSGEYRQLIQALNRKDRNAINSHSRNLKAAFDNGEYFTLLSSYIRDFLESEAPSFNNIARPKAVIKQLYVELVLRGYEVDEIKELFSNIVSPCEVTDGGKLNTRFPVYLIPNRWDMSVQEVADFINRLSFPDRLLYLDRHFFADSVTGFCAFHVTGLAISSRVEIGDVLFLPPDQKFADFNGVKLDLKHLRFVDYDKPEIYPVCVVRTKGATGKQAAREAISKFEIVHRTILLYFRTKMRIKAESTSWAFYNSEGTYRTNKYSSKIQDQQFNALSLTSEKLVYIEDGMLPVVGAKSDTELLTVHFIGMAVR